MSISWTERVSLIGSIIHPRNPDVRVHINATFMNANGYWSEVYPSRTEDHRCERPGDENRYAGRERAGLPVQRIRVTTCAGRSPYRLRGRPARDLVTWRMSPP